MSWKPKTIFGKILKGAVIAGGSVLGLASGFGIAGAVKGVVKGTGALAGIGKGVGALKNITDKIKDGAARILTGNTKEERGLINAQKELTRENQRKLDLVEKLVNAGATPEDARAQVGLSDIELTSFKDTPLEKTSIGNLFKNPVVLVGAAVLAGLFLLPKIMKR